MRGGQGGVTAGWGVSPWAGGAAFVTGEEGTASPRSGERRRRSSCSVKPEPGAGHCPLVSPGGLNVPARVPCAPPRSPFVLDEFKRKYSNEDTLTVALPHFWEHFDKEGWSLWYAEYRFPEELTQTFMSCNLITGEAPAAPLALLALLFLASSSFCCFLSLFFFALVLFFLFPILFLPSRIHFLLCFFFLLLYFFLIFFALFSVSFVVAFFLFFFNFIFCRFCFMSFTLLFFLFFFHLSFSIPHVSLTLSSSFPLFVSSFLFYITSHSLSFHFPSYFLPFPLPPSPYSLPLTLCPPSSQACSSAWTNSVKTLSPALSCSAPTTTAASRASGSSAGRSWPSR